MIKNIMIGMASICGVLFLDIPCAGSSVGGRVFDDADGDGIMGFSERGIGGVYVSNQKDVVCTRADGSFEIEAAPGEMIYVVKPADYSFTQGMSPAYFRVRDGKNNGYDFGLRHDPTGKQFSILVLGDPQMRGEGPLKAFREDILDEIAGMNPRFAFVLGDVADNDLTVFPAYKNMISKLAYPVYNAFGNHDADHGATDFERQSVTFRGHFGPDYYALNEGDVHLIVLNNVYYGLRNPHGDKRESYTGGMSEREFEWLENDLATVGADKLIVLAMHIPLLREYTLASHIDRLFGLLEGRRHLLALSGHLHRMQNYTFGREHRWKGAAFRNITVGATCGSWWTGPADERGVPASTCMDGSPNGYFRLDFDGNTCSYHFIPANHREDFQMRITCEAGILYANIFSASPQCSVQFSIDGATAYPMNNVAAEDPFIRSTYGLRYNFDNWRPRLVPSDHLWQATLPDRPERGVYRIEVTAHDTDGKRYTGNKIIEMK